MEPTDRVRTPVIRQARSIPREAGTDLGTWIRTNRLRINVSQRELADRAQISRSYLCDIERGRGTKPSIDALDRIATALGAERTEVLREAGILDPDRGPRESTREQKLVALFRGLSDGGQDTLERFARYLLSEDQHWVQPRLVDEPSDGKPLTVQTGPGLFDEMGIEGM